MRIPGIAAMALAGLVLAPAAGAHVTVQPTELPSGGFARIDIRVPNESDELGHRQAVGRSFPTASDSPPTSRSPAGPSRSSARPWPSLSRLRTARSPSRSSTITWTGDGKAGIIPPDAFQDFGVSIGVPEGAGRDAHLQGRADLR